VTTGHSSGWGLLLTADGHILTGADLVEDAGGEPVEVTFRDGQTVEAEPVGTDERTLLAVVRVDSVPAGAGPVEFGDSLAVAAGDPVTVRPGPAAADRSPLPGDVTDNSALVGAVSMIQTDIEIGPGGGGLLYNDRDEIIGIVTSFTTAAGGDAPAASLAVPADLAGRVADELIAGGQVAHPYLGVSVEASDGGGAVVRQVPGDGPAAAAGLQAGDVIVDVDGSAVEDPADLVAAVQARAVGDESTITFQRGGTERTATVTLDPAPEG
jgi:putative serine protease PepD